jgi:hypothetical protein
MANLRLVEITAQDSTTIRARFTEDLDPLINTANISIVANEVGVVNPDVLKVVVSDDVLTITTRPLTPFALYFVTLQSTDQYPFRSLNGTSFILEDGKTNVPTITGPEDPANAVRDVLINFLKDNIYSLEHGTVIRSIINSQANDLARASHDIGQARNDNYLEHIVTNELKTRGPGPYDRLNEEGAYQVHRVGKTPSDVTASTYYNHSDFPSGLITLLARTVTSETLSAGSGSATFDGLVLTVANRFVTKLNSVTFNYASGAPATYEISSYGYQVENPVYDEDYASTLLTLEDNQFKLSDAVIGELTLPAAGDTIEVSYDYKHKGRIVNEDSVVVSQVIDVIRESVLPIVNELTLDHAPIVTSADIIATNGGVQFLDPSANPPFSSAHPAFTTEIPFKFSGLPTSPGEFAVDYNTGRVFVYGAAQNDGTGNFPPVATYKYRKSFVEGLDYTYDAEVSDLVASPLRDLVGEVAKILFDYEETLVPDIDFVAQIHTEVLDERIENRINSTNSVSSSYSPITNVFRVYNETSGEIYDVTRWSDSSIYFTYNTPPRMLDITRERASFKDVLNETLILDSESTNLLGTRVFKFLLSNNRIMSSTEDLIGSSYNSSVTFSRADIFETELYYDAQILTVAQNTDRLQEAQYQVDYRNGIIYVGVSSSQIEDVGTVNYKEFVIDPQYPHLVSVSELYHSISQILGVNDRVQYLSFGDDEIVPASYFVSDERFLNDDTTLPYTVVSDQITVSGDIKNVRNIYDAYDLNNNTPPTNFVGGITTSANVITLSSSGIAKQEIATISAGSNVVVSFISSGAEIVDVTSVTRISDNAELYDGYGTFSGYTITLSGTGSPLVGQAVLVKYRVALNSAATPIVDYNRGDYFIDYTYLADEILISYEHGDNVIDFRDSGVLDKGDEYYVSYKVGALRDALLKNFGSLVDIPILNEFDTTLPRENYRDALTAALQSFTRGPTKPAINDLVSHITHIDPRITEAAFQNWSLGVSSLYSNGIDYTNDLQLLSGKFDNGALVTNDDETVTFPVASNLRLESGTLEMWVVPEWDGLDNDATLTFQIYKDGYTVSASEIFIGATSYNPTYDDDNMFTLNRDDAVSPEGLPSAVYINTGVFIYYDTDDSRWKLLVRERPLTSARYTGTVWSSGEVYDVKFIAGLKEINDMVRSGISSIEFEMNIDGYDQQYPDGYGTPAQTENLFSYSEQFEYSNYWSLTDGYISSNTLPAPPTFTDRLADEFLENSAVGVHRPAYVALNVGGAGRVTLSAYAKRVIEIGSCLE